ncbi:MAG: nitrilase-related carbon-nitrogen hydrolase [Oscillospiraceae bacterium]
MNRARLRASAFMMGYLASPEKVREQIELLNLKDGGQPPYIGAAGVKLAAVCLAPRIYRNLADYVGDMNRLVSASAAAGAHLVALPELSGMLPVTLMPGFSAVLNDWKRSTTGDLETPAERFCLACEAVQGFVGEIFHNTMSLLAKSHHLCIAAGSVYLFENHQLYNRQYLFSETGEVVGMQNKLFLSRFEQSAGVIAGDAVTPAETRLGRIALFTGNDVPHCEPFLIAQAMGCAFAVAGASPFGATAALGRCRAQESRMCVLSPGLSGGQELSLNLHEPSVIYVPRAAARAGDGVAALSADGSATARVDLSRVASQLDLYTDDKNPDFFRALLR